MKKHRGFRYQVAVKVAARAQLKREAYPWFDADVKAEIANIIRRVRIGHGLPAEEPPS